MLHHSVDTTSTRGATCCFAERVRAARARQRSSHPSSPVINLYARCATEKASDVTSSALERSTRSHTNGEFSLKLVHGWKAGSAISASKAEITS